MQVAELTYRVTSQLPISERVGLYAQMRRSSVSIGSNISEGCGRSSDAQFCSFLQIAMGSACELEFQTRLARRLSLAPPGDLQLLEDAITATKRMLAKLTVSVRARVTRRTP